MPFSTIWAKFPGRMLRSSPSLSRLASSLTTRLPSALQRLAATCHSAFNGTKAPAVSGNSKAVLTLSAPLIGGNAYTLTVQNVQDSAGNAILQTNLAFTAMVRTVDPALTPPYHLVGDQIYNNINGASVASLTG